MKRAAARDQLAQKHQRQQDASSRLEQAGQQQDSRCWKQPMSVKNCGGGAQSRRNTWLAMPELGVACGPGAAQAWHSVEAAGSFIAAECASTPSTTLLARGLCTERWTMELAATILLQPLYAPSTAWPIWFYGHTWRPRLATDAIPSHSLATCRCKVSWPEPILGARAKHSVENQHTSAILSLLAKTTRGQETRLFMHSSPTPLFFCAESTMSLAEVGKASPLAQTGPRSPILSPALRPPARGA